MKNKKLKILLSGGGTMGPVSPLLALLEEFNSRGIELEVLWLGTHNGPEGKLLKEKGISFKPIFSGKIRRYFSLLNFLDPLFVLLGFFQSFFYILVFQPNFILTSGGFVAVPVAWAGAFLFKPVYLHQQDIRVTFSNKLMAPIAKKITVTFSKSLKDFSSRKTVWTGNAIRKDHLIGEREKALKDLGFSKDLPVLLIFGGGTGAWAINQLVESSIVNLVGFCQVIHITGKGRGGDYEKTELVKKRYRRYEFLTTGMGDAYAASDFVLTRAGASSLSEIAELKKPCVVIPIPKSHQEENAKVLEDAKAALVLNQESLTTKEFSIQLKMFVTDKESQTKYIKNLEGVTKGDGAKNIVDLILER